MKPKQLLILLVTVVVLGGLVFLKKAADTPDSIFEQVSLSALVPQDLTNGDIQKLEIYAGAAAEEKLVLTKKQAGDAWQVTTHFDAPVLKAKIDSYLDAIVGLEGEFRASTSGEDDLGAYDLTDEAGFHVIGSGAGNELFHLILGKSSGTGVVFARDAGDASNDVYVADSDLRKDAGIFSEERDAKPEPGTWLNKEILKLDRAAINQIALNFPDKKLVMDHEEVPAEPIEEPAEGEEPPPPAPKEYRWVTTSGGIGEDPRESGINSILSKLANLNGTDIVDPSKKADWNLESPEYSCTVTVEGETGPVVIEGGRSADNTTGYLRVASNEQDIVYSISKYNFEQLFPKGSALFTLPALSLASTDVATIEYTLEGETVKMARTEDEWAVVEPESTLPLVTSTPSSIASALARWRAEDYADSDDTGDLEGQPRTIQFTMSDGSAHSIAIGNPSKNFDGFYVNFDDSGRVLATSKAEITKLFVPAKNLFDRSMLDEDRDEISAIQVTRADGTGTYALRRENGEWKVESGGEVNNADGALVYDFVETLSDLSAEDIGFGADPATLVPWATVSFTSGEGAQQELIIAAKADEVHAAVLTGNANVFLLSAENVAKISPDLNSIRVLPPLPASDEASTETEDAPGDASEAPPEEE